MKDIQLFDAKMELWKCSAFSFIVFGLWCAFAKNKHCEWVLDAVQKENLSQVAPVIIPGGQYFLRIRVKCNDKVNCVKLWLLISLFILESNELMTDFRVLLFMSVVTTYS